jgi:hypothetical protein
LGREKAVIAMDDVTMQERAERFKRRLERKLELHDRRRALDRSLEQLARLERWVAHVFGGDR